ncbi:MAG: aspartate--ammonia ligase [Christensenellaceae bacterium]
MRRLTIPDGYRPSLNLVETERAIKHCKDLFESELAALLKLTRVSAPLFVLPQTGLNDNLNGVERPVSFDIADMEGTRCEVVHSLAKWKRQALHRYGFAQGEGLYTDMNAIRRDEEMDNLHSIYVDQWDWEVILSAQERTRCRLHRTVEDIYTVFLSVEAQLKERWPQLTKKLPERIHFITAEQLMERFPDLTPAQREDAAAREWGAVFIEGIGAPLSNGKPHDGRAPDYDDWTLNGDIVFYYPLLDRAFEVSSMGIRVDAAALRAQCEANGCPERLALPFHRQVLSGELPLTMGGGIGQSRICMYLLDKAHIGEVQASIWPQDQAACCAEHHIALL